MAPGYTDSGPAGIKPTVGLQSPGPEPRHRRLSWPMVPSAMGYLTGVFMTTLPGRSYHSHL